MILATHMMSMDPTMRNAMAGEDGAARTQDGKLTGELDGLRLAWGEPTRMGMYRDIMQM